MKLWIIPYSYIVLKYASMKKYIMTKLHEWTRIGISLTTALTIITFLKRAFAYTGIATGFP